MYFPPEVTKEMVLSCVSEEEIFERYGIPVVNYVFCNPKRPDKHPTCTFYRSRNTGKLYMRDWAGYFWGDCFDLVKQEYNCNYYQALQKIAADFGLIDPIKLEPVKREPAKAKICTREGYPDIRVKRRPWNNTDMLFWNRWDFKLETLEKFNVSPAQRVWLNGRPCYLYNKEDPAYIYHFGGYEYKIYYPYRKEHRFLHSNPYVLQGFSQLPDKGKYMLVTKSYKDVMKLYEFGIPSVAPMSESQIPTTDQYINLSSRFEFVFSLYDTDRRGVMSMQKMKREYGIKPLFFPRDMPKDFTDFYEAFGQEDTELLVRTVQDQLI